MKGVIGAALLLCLSATAMASPIRLEVTGSACSVDTVEADVVELVPAELSAVPELRVLIETVRDRDTVVAMIWFPERSDSERGPRVIRAATCGELRESMALVIAMALVPDRNDRAPARAASVDEPAEITRSAAAVPDKMLAAAIVQRVQSQPTHASAVGVYIGGGSGLLAGARGQLVVGARARRSSQSLSLQLRADAAEERDVTQMASVRVRRSDLSLAPCAHLGAFAGCGVATAGTIHGEGRGLHGARSAFTPLFAAGLRVTAEHSIVGPVAIRAYIEAQAHLTSAQFDVDYVPVWKSQRFEASGGIGVLARFL